MEIDPTKTGLGATAATSQGALTDAASADMGRDDFLKLLTTQLQAQDPLSPLQNHEFVAQLAQFSSLEQQVITNDSLARVQLAQMSLANGQLTEMIGKEVVARGDVISVDGGSAEPIGAEFHAAAAKATVNIKGPDGTVVRTIELPPQSEGSTQIPWDGLDDNGQPLPEGDYKVEIAAEDHDGNSVVAETLTKGVVTGLDFSGGIPELLIGDQRILPADIISIQEPSEELLIDAIPLADQQGN